jgi:hypothetical protein
MKKFIIQVTAMYRSFRKVRHRDFFLVAVAPITQVMRGRRAIAREANRQESQTRSRGAAGLAPLVHRRGATQMVALEVRKADLTAAANVVFVIEAFRDRRDPHSVRV